MPRTVTAGTTSNGIEVQRPKTVNVNYKNEAGESLMVVRVTEDGTVTILVGETAINLSADQLKDLRRRISQSLNK